MSQVSLPPALFWVIPPVFGALLGFTAGRTAARLSLHRVRMGLRGIVTKVMPRLTAGLLEKSMADFLPDGPDALAGPIRKVVEGAIRGLITTPRFLHEVRLAMSGAVSSVCALPVSDLLSRINAKPFFVERLLPVLAKAENRKAISQAAGAAVSERSGALVSDDFLKDFSGPLAEFLPVVIEQIIQWMESREMRDTMAERARELLPRILEKLNVMQRLLLSAGQFDRRIDEKMPEILEETLQALERIIRDPLQQRAMRDRILLAIKDWRDSRDSRRDAAQLIAEIADRYLEGLGEPAAGEGIYRALEAFLTEGGQTLGGFLRKQAGLSDNEISDSLANLVLSWLSRPETAASLASWVSRTAAGFLRDDAARQLGRVLLTDARRKEKIDAFLIEACARIAAESGPQVANPARRGIMRWAGLSGCALGLAIGLLEDALRLFGIG